MKILKRSRCIVAANFPSLPNSAVAVNSWCTRPHFYMFLQILLSMLSASIYIKYLPLDMKQQHNQYNMYTYSYIITGIFCKTIAWIVWPNISNTSVRHILKSVTNINIQVDGLYNFIVSLRLLQTIRLMQDYNGDVFSKLTI